MSNLIRYIISFWFGEYMSLTDGAVGTLRSVCFGLFVLQYVRKLLEISLVKMYEHFKYSKGPHSSPFYHSIKIL